MKNQFLNVWSRPYAQRIRGRKRAFYANYFTILFTLALFGDPSVLSAQTCSGNAVTVVSQTGVDNPSNALNAPDAAAAQLWDTGDQIVLDLNQRLNSGSTVVVTWRGNTTSTADPIVIVETSLDGTTFTAVAGSPFTLSRATAYYTNNIVMPSAARYVRFTTTNTFNVDLDALTFTNQACSPLCGTATAGTVWRDFNGNGVKEANEKEGVANVTVTAYDCLGAVAATTTTNNAGEFTFTTLSPSATNKYRIEYSNVPPPYKPTFNGSDGRTDVQFITAASCDLDYGVNSPADYCQANPALMINCYVTGAYSSSTGTGHTLVGLPYNYTQDRDGNVNGSTVTGNPVPGTQNQAIYTPARPSPTPIADHNQIGSTWGLAYSRTQKDLFVASYIKAGMSLGPTDESTGKIYKINDPLGAKTVSAYVDLNAIFGAGTTGANPHPIATTNFSDLGDASTNAVIGKVGLGDLAISSDEAFLYVVNLADRMLYKIPTSGVLNSTTITRIAIPTTGLPTVTNAIGTAGTCPSADMRPFGLGVDPKGDIYVGGVCSCESISLGFNAEPNPASYQLTAYVWKFDGTAFSLVLDKSLRFDRTNNGSYTTGDDFTGNSGRRQGWEPWHDLSNPAIYNTNEPAQNEPMLADISFDEKGDMFLGIRDRLGDCVTLNGGFMSSGDIYKVAKTGSTWTFENNATAGGITTSGFNNGEGPGGGEFIYGDIQGDGIVNSGTGGVFNLMGTYQVVSTAVDAVYLNSGGQTIFNPSAGGVQLFGTQDGALKGAFNLYEKNDVNTFAKAAGIGSIAALCDPAPIEIGNYVWFDQDKDGVQDPCETPLSNVTVSLWKNGVQIATITTSSNGEYYFSSKSKLGTPANWTGTGADTTLLPNMAYEVRIATNQGLLSMRELTTANSTINSGNDQNDSDGILVGGDAVISFTTGAAGSTNHTLDFGFQCIPPTIMNVAATSATCTEGTANSNAEVHVTGITGMTKYAYKTNATDSLWANTATASTATSIDLTGLANPSVSKTYTFRIWASDTTCFNDTTVVLNPAVCPLCSITAMFAQGVCNNNGTTAISADDYFTVTVSNVTSTNSGTSGKYEVILNGSVLNIGGTAYGTPVTVGGILDFKSDGTTTYNLTVRDLSIPTCVTTVFTTAVSAACSTIGCKPIICLPVTVTKF